MWEERSSVKTLLEEPFPLIQQIKSKKRWIIISNYKRKEENKVNNNSGIYCIVNKSNNKVYVGQTYNLNYRWNRHKHDLNHGYHSNKHLQSAWNKYGSDSFEFLILEECNLDTIDSKEKYWIDYYNSIKSGYNQCDGGIGCRGYKHTEEELEKMRQIQTPKRVIQLDKNGIEIKRWTSASEAGKTLNLYILSIKNCCEQKSYVKSVGGFIWIYEQDEYNVDMNYYFTNNQSKSNAKSVAQYDYNMNLIKVWSSIKDACDVHGFNREGIRKVCNGDWNQYKGFIWKLVE